MVQTKRRTGAGRLRIKAMKVWCFGDSNTYGYDPCGFFGGRYSEPWPALLAEKNGFEVVNDGRNGRIIPAGDRELREFRRDEETLNADALVVMLGTNDLLEGASAGEAAARMETFLARCTVPSVILVCPPPMKRGAWVPDDRVVEESAELTRRYKALAERSGVHCADAGEWEIGLAYDGVHFVEEGHRRFAEALSRYMNGHQTEGREERL